MCRVLINLATCIDDLSKSVNSPTIQRNLWVYFFWNTVYNIGAVSTIRSTQCRIVTKRQTDRQTDNRQTANRHLLRANTVLIH